jgi:Tfp pilus assembly protein PilX
MTGFALVICVAALLIIGLIAWFAVSAARNNNG